MDEKALEILGLNEADFAPKQENGQDKEQRIEDLEKALSVLLGGETE